MSQDVIAVPKGWELTTLFDITISHDGKRTPLNKSQRSQIQGKYPYYGASGQVDSINDYKLDGKFILLAEDGENLNSRKKPIAFIVEGKFWVNNHAHVLEPTEKILIDYLCHYINSLNIMKFAKKQSTRPKLNKTDMNEIPILLPSLQIQKQIVAKLDHVLGELEVKKKEILSLIEQNKERIDFFEKNFFSQIMKKYLQIDNVPETWTVKSLGNIATRIGGGTPKKNNDEYYQGDIPWFTISDLSNEITFPKIIHNSKMKITEKAIKESSAKKIPKNAVILGTRVGVGKLAIAGREVTTNQDFSSFVCSKEIEPYFLGCYFLAIRQHLQQKSRGLTVKGIITSELDNLSIGYPSNEEQTKIIQNIKSAEQKFQSQKKQFENIKNNYESKINYINHIQSSVLDSAFSGKLVQ